MSYVDFEGWQLRLLVFQIMVVAVSMLFFMTRCKQQDPEKLLIFAHRGASKIAPENTLVAIQKAIEFGADYSELDVFQTKDGEIVLMHDEDLERTTGKKGKIWEYTLAELKNMEVGSWFSAEFNGEPIPTLQEAIALARGRIRLNIEVKISDHETDIVRKVIDIVRTENFIKDCMITSFDHDAIHMVKELAPEVFAGFIFDEDYKGDVFGGNWDALCCNRKLANRVMAKKAKRKGKKLFVWTVNEPREMEKILDLGVDGIITDVPDVLREIVDKKYLIP